MRFALVSTLAILMAGCSNAPSPVYGKCRFCGKPGYAFGAWLDKAAAQSAVDRGDQAIVVICAACRKKYGFPVDDGAVKD